jgi:type IV secretion system protein VirB5
MVRRHLVTAVLASLLALMPTSASRAQGIPVIDIASVMQLIQEMQYWIQQIQLMKNQVDQLQQTYAAVTGPRGMQNLLAGSLRNYLPPDWNEMIGVINNANATYSGLATQVQAVMNANAVLSKTQVNGLSPRQQQILVQGRRSAAMMQVMSQAAYENTSQRFSAIQQLINAIGGARDTKAIQDLQGRISAEQAMLQNEQTKLHVLFQSAQADQWAQQQRIREESLNAVGSYGTANHPSF